MTREEIITIWRLASPQSVITDEGLRICAAIFKASQPSLTRTLQSIVDAYDFRSELYTSDAECAAALADKARAAIKLTAPKGA
jgi:hypothetical protein